MPSTPSGASRIDDKETFPHDELGDISNHIIRLYARLQRTTADRDREHALALHEEQEKIRIKKQLTNNINHELKTPVAAIQGYLETLLANPCLTAEKRTAFLEKSCAQVERLRHLLSDVSTITRMDEGRELIGKEPVVLNDLIDEVRADMELRPEGQRLRVNCDFQGPVEVEGNPSLLSSVFRNLADNAAAYSGGRDIFIRLLSDTAEACTILSPTTASASTKNTSRTSSSGSTVSTRGARASWAARDSGFRSSKTPS